jgi:hypothetical protein
MKKPCIEVIQGVLERLDIEEGCRVCIGDMQSDY